MKKAKHSPPGSAAFRDGQRATWRQAVSPLRGASTHRAPGMLPHPAPEVNSSPGRAGVCCPPLDTPAGSGAARPGENVPLGGWWEQGYIPAGQGSVSQHFGSGGCKRDWGGGHRGCARAVRTGLGKQGEPRVCPEHSSHMPCVRPVGLIQELSAPPREVSDAFIYKPTGSCTAPASHMQEKAHRSQDKQSQQHPCTAGGSAERAKDAPAGLPGPGGRRWHHGPGAGLQQHGLPWHSRKCPLCAGSAGALRSRWGDANGIPNAAPSAGDAACTQGQRGM